MATSKPRVRAYVDHDTYAKLQFATTRPHVSISDTVNNALKVYLSDEYSLEHNSACLLYTSPSPRDLSTSRMPSSA